MELFFEGLNCANCASKIERKVSNLDGVREAAMNFMAQTMVIDIEDESMRDAIKDIVIDITHQLEPDVVVKEVASPPVKAKTTSKTMELFFEGLNCANCASKIESKVSTLDGVSDVAMNFMAQTMVIHVKNESMRDAIKDIVIDITHQLEPDVVVKEVTSSAKGKVPSEVVENDDTKAKEKRLFSGAVSLSEVVWLALSMVLFVVAYLPMLPQWARIGMFVVSYLIAGSEVLVKAFSNIFKGHVFDENFLMTIATIGAFIIGEYPEGVAVMLFYQVGEMFQKIAVHNSRRSIKSLLDIRSDSANLLVDGAEEKVDPVTVAVGSVILVKPGERVPLDGVVLSGESMLDTSALTGETVPRSVKVGEDIMSGCINQTGLLTVEVTKEFGESTVSKILDMVQNASQHKAPTENFITKFARVYTPIVVIIALLLAFVPPLVIPGHSFNEWIYRALAFLVVSCPCALVISIPMGFFGGIGAASKNGILVKGSNYLEALNYVDTAVFDKTGTLTKGTFEVVEIAPSEGFSEDELLERAALAESHSSHPIALSILKAYSRDVDQSKVMAVEDISGFGLRVTSDDGEILVGNGRLMEREGVNYVEDNTGNTVVYVALNKAFMGRITIADQVKEDAVDAINGLRELNVKRIVMLTGDREGIANNIGMSLGVDEVYSDLLPGEKVEVLEKLYTSSGKGKIMFVGDGINDAPVLARADIGVAMGGVGSDAAIEAADVVLMTDEPSKLQNAIKIARKTHSIVSQNIAFALFVKVAVLVLVAFGMSTMWEAVFADVGVSVIAILNSMRMMRYGRK